MEYILIESWCWGAFGFLGVFIGILLSSCYYGARMAMLKKELEEERTASDELSELNLQLEDELKHYREEFNSCGYPPVNGQG